MFRTFTKSPLATMGEVVTDTCAMAEHASGCCLASSWQDLIEGCDLTIVILTYTLQSSVKEHTCLRRCEGLPTDM